MNGTVDERDLAAKREAGRYAHGVLLGDADLDRPLGELPGHPRDMPATVNADGEDGRVVPRDLEQQVAVRLGHGLLPKLSQGGLHLPAVEARVVAVGRLEERHALAFHGVGDDGTRPAAFERNRFERRNE